MLDIILENIYLTMQLKLPNSNEKNIYNQILNDSRIEAYQL
jgi:hypothetical protein